MFYIFADGNLKYYSIKVKFPMRKYVFCFFKESEIIRVNLFKFHLFLFFKDLVNDTFKYEITIFFNNI